MAVLLLDVKPEIVTLLPLLESEEYIVILSPSENPRSVQLSTPAICIEQPEELELDIVTVLVAEPVK